MNAAADSFASLSLSPSEYVQKLSEFVIPDEEKSRLHCSVSTALFIAMVKRLTRIYLENEEDLQLCATITSLINKSDLFGNTCLHYASKANSIPNLEALC